MKRKQHGRFKRKRSAIDLNSLTKRQRQKYRQDAHEFKRQRQEKEEKPRQEEKQVSDSESSSSSSEEEEQDTYKQLLSNLGGGASGFKSDSEDSEDEDETVETPADDQTGDHGNSNHSDDSDDAQGDGDEVLKTAGSLKGKKHIETEEQEESDEGSDSETEQDLEGEENDEDILKNTDPFVTHFEQDLDEKVAERLSGCTNCKKQEVKVPHVGSGVLQWSQDSLKVNIRHRKDRDLSHAHVKQNLCSNLPDINTKLCKATLAGSESLTNFQSGLFTVINNYQDILYTERSQQNGEEIRLLYSLHALNHILKTRKRVISHNTKLKENVEPATEDEYRDQGLTRPKVLIVVPFRESAKRIVEMMIQLLNPTDQVFVANKKRFFKEYGIAPEDEVKKGKKPEDYEAIFDGNTDDHFRIGIGVAKKTLKLYTKFYSADIIIASPLGLRTLIGSEGEKDRDYDFLNSLEVLVLDQADIFLMQNWDHILHLVKHLHLQPQESHGVDFSRVRMWNLNGWSKYYRQNLVFSSVPVPEVTALFNKHCHNYAGRVMFSRKPSQGTISQIALQLPQVFHKIECSSYGKLPDDRFDFFVKKILPQLKGKTRSPTLIYIPSYFDFVRLRNYFRREEIDFMQVTEYTKDKNVNTARNLFYHKRVQFMLYTERYHFYRRSHMRGIEQLVFYGIPQYPHFYSEVCNMLFDLKSVSKASDQTCTVLYSKYEVLRLAEIVGTDRAGQMVHSGKNVHMFVTGENG